MSTQHHIKHYGLEQGALEIEYIEEFFGEFPKKKRATDIIRRLTGRQHLILMAEARLSDGPSPVVPVSFKVAHELFHTENEPDLVDLVTRLDGWFRFEERRILYTWLGGTRIDWRGQGHFRALTEEQEEWAMNEGYAEILVKTKNKFYEMRGTLAQLGYHVIHFERATDSGESKLYLSKQLGPHVLKSHRSTRRVVRA